LVLYIEVESEDIHEPWFKSQRTESKNERDIRNIRKYIVMRNPAVPTHSDLTPEGSEAFHLVQHVLSCFSVGTGARNTVVRQPHPLPMHVLFPRDFVPFLGLLYLTGDWHTLPRQRIYRTLEPTDGHRVRWTTEVEHT
jgi:hypothetical protein